MKNLLNIVLLASLVMLAGCVKEVEQDLSNVEDSMRYSVLTAGFADYQTKTYVEEGKYLRWHANDRITAFFGNTLNRQYEFEGENGDNSGSFRYISSGVLETGNEIDRIYAVYPYDKSIKYIEGGKIQLSLPAVQNYAENSFGKGANTMVAVTADVEDTFLPFKNVCGYLKLRLKGEVAVKSIEISGNAGEKISGKAMVTLVKGVAPELVMNEDATENVKLDCGDGVELSADEEKEFWFALPETVFENGISVVVETTTGTRYAKCTKNKIPIVRNQIQPMAALSVPDDFYAEGLNVIEYTAPSQVVLSTSRAVFNSIVVGHKYNPLTQKGVIICDKPITTIGYQAFVNSNLRNITLPESVTEIKDEAFRWCVDLSGVYYKSTYPPTLGSGVFWCNAKYMPLIHFVPSNVLENYTKEWSNKPVCPYDYEQGYPAIPDDEIWYFESQICTYDDTKFGSVSVKSNEYDQYSQLGILKFSGSVEKIDYGAFNHGTFDALILPGKVESVDCNCLKSKLLFLPNSLNSVTSFNRDIIQEMVGDYISADGRCLIINNRLYIFADYGMSDKEYSIPYGVTSIAGEAMRSCRLKHLNIPNTVSGLGQMSLADNYFDNLIIPDSVESIPVEAFVGLRITSLTLGNNVKSIGWHAFSGCDIESIYCRTTIPPKAYKFIYGNWDLFGGYSGYIPENTTIYVPVGCGAKYKVDEEWGVYKKSISEFEL